MSGSPRRAAVLASALMALLTASPVGAVHLGRSPCDTGIPSDETLGIRWFPRGDLFCPLIADPKGDGSFLSYVRGSSTSALGTDIGSVGIGDRMGIFRWNGPALGDGVQLSLSGNLYAQFDLNTASFDLINADYLISLPLTFRQGPVSGRLRLYHQSSHLGDEYLLRGNIQRENFAFEAIESVLSADLGPLRAYGGGDYLFASEPSNLVSWVAHGGVELRQPGGLLPAERIGGIRLVGGLDVKSVEALDWKVAWSGRAGFEIGHRPESEHGSRRWSLMGEYYDGPSPYGQFFHDHVSYYGVGIHLGL